MSTAAPDARPARDVYSLPNFRLLKLQIAVRWQRPNRIPGPVIANVLRGALGITLRKLVCPPELFNEPCSPCPLYAGCAYGRVFAPTPPPDAPQLSRQADLPRPFVLEPPGLHPDAPMTPEGLTFGLMLFGTAIERLPFLITALARLGQEGMGRDRVPFTIASITAQHPAGDELLFSAGSSQMRLPQRAITNSDLPTQPPLATTHMAHSPAVEPAREPQLPAASSARDAGAPGRRRGPAAGRPQLLAPLSASETGGARLMLRFLTPTLLKTGSHIDGRGRRVPAGEVRERPPFGVIVRRLRDRLSALSAFFGEPWQTDFAELGRQADAVELIASQTVWLDRHRRSTRTGHAHELSGFIGQAVYQFPSAAALAHFWPLLSLGQHLHVGKFAPWGNGKVEISN